MSKNVISIIIISFLCLGNLFSQNIDTNTLQKIRSEYKNQSEHDKAVRNALSNNDVRAIALNRSVAGKVEHHFKYRVEVTGITDQKSSGRCWMFTGLNALRPVLIKSKNLSGFEFSTNYLFFYDMLEKCNLFLEITLDNATKPFNDRTVEWIFKNPLSDGGVWNSFANLVEKYGFVPKEIMPETYHSENTSWMNRLLSRKLRENALELRMLTEQNKSKKEISDRKYQMLAEIYRTLSLFLGEPPTEFSYRFVDKEKNIGEYKTYTPQSFFAEMFPDYKTSDYVMLMNDPTREYYKMYEIEYDRNVLEGQNWKYLNLPSEEIKKFAFTSIKNNEAMYASCDVGKQLNRTDGTLDINNYDFEALLGLKFGMNKRDRINTYDSGSSHAMLLMAVDTDDDNNFTKWQFENSWGISHGHNGYLTFTDKWFDEYMFRVVVNKKYLDTKTINMLEQETIILPPWDPMFLEDF
ncbi:C1 family peptidase [Bacteroidales bacterium OttesenSCG-928-I21]|nr:C1 family peptidase [Bacteroidales bacterium OttesenSCG-928-I21]